MNNRRQRRINKMLEDFQVEYDAMTKKEQKKVDAFFKVLENEIPNDQKSIPEIRQELNDKFRKIEKNDKDKKSKVETKKDDESN